jgi:glycosyltransferase involved in cell wall biosynthesis
VLLVQGECLLAEKARSAGIPVEVADFDLADVGPLALNYSFDCLRRNNPAVVHLDTMLAPALMIAAYIQRIPIVGHVRCVVAPEMRIPQLVHFLDCAITVSDCVDKSLRRTSFDERRIVRIYDAIDLRDYDPAQYNRQELRQSAGLPEDAFVVSMLARIHPDKRQETLLRALGDLKPDHPDIYVVIAGHTHHREYLDRLRRLVDEMGLQERVLFWGFEPEPARVYAISDLVALCMPAEGWGRCTAEAMAMGVPVIAPDAGGSTELVSHGEDGLLYSAGDSSELAASIAALRLDPAMRARLRHAARVKAASYSVERHVSARLTDCHDADC